MIEFNGFGEKYGVTDLEVYETLLDCGFLPYIYSHQNKKLHLQEHYNTNKFNTLLIKDLNYITEDLYRETDRKINEVKAMLIGLLKKIRQ